MKMLSFGKFILLPTLAITASGFVLSAHASTPPRTQAGSFAQANVARVAYREASDAVTETVITSETITPSFSFNGLLASWPRSLDLGGENTLQIRYESKGAWSGWIALDALHDAPTNAALPADRDVSEPFFLEEATRLEYRLSGDATLVDSFGDVSFTYINTATPARPLGWLQQLFDPRSALADGNVPIVSRAAWGADESYRLSSSGGELWSPSYAAVEKFIIHHTAGSNGGSDPASVIRGIYYFHAVVLGWGDIGYNYLIDPAGRIYEGRYGGDGVVAGHTYNDQEGVDYNRGTIGIAFLGNYQDESFSSAEQTSVNALLGEKARLFSILPTGTGNFRNRSNLPNIIGHRDVDATTCPGTNIYGTLASLRVSSQAVYDSLPPVPAPDFSATSNTQAVTLNIEGGKSLAVSLNYTNTSNVSWQSYIPSRRITLRPVGTSKLGSAGWQEAGIVGVSDVANVAPQATVNFTLPLTGPSDELSRDEFFALFRPDGSEVPGTRVSIHADILNLPYAASIESFPLPPATFVKDTRTIPVVIKNRGTVTWQRGEIVLRAFDLNDRPSVFRATGWPDATAGIKVNSVVAPGGLVTINLPFRTPATPGLYLNILRLQRSNGSSLAGDDRSNTMRADSRWQAQLMSKSLPLAILHSWQPTMVVKFKNTGVATWDRSLRLRVYDVGFRASPFRHSTWPSAYANAVMQERSVKPGQTGTFVLRLRPPSKTGVYRQILRLEIPGSSTLVQNGSADFLTRVD